MSLLDYPEAQALLNGTDGKNPPQAAPPEWER